MHTHTHNKKQVCTDFFSVRSVSFVVLFHSLSHPIFAVINEQRKQKVAPFYRSKTSQNLQIIQSNVIIFRVNFYVACSLNALLNSKMLRFFLAYFLNRCFNVWRFRIFFVRLLLSCFASLYCYVMCL